MSSKLGSADRSLQCGQPLHRDSSWLGDDLLNVCVVGHRQGLVAAAGDRPPPQPRLATPLPFPPPLPPNSQ